jgi:transposase-like protein
MSCQVSIAVNAAMQAKGPRSGTLDEMVVKIAGKRIWLWHAVDGEDDGASFFNRYGLALTL